MMTEASARATVRRCFPGPRTPPARPCPMLIPPHHSPHHATAARPHNNLTALPLPRLSTHATLCLPPLPGYTVSGQGLTLPGAALQQRSARLRARGDAHYHDAGALATFLPVHHVGAARRGRGGAVAGAQTGGRGWAGVQLTCCLVPCRQPLAVERRGEGGDFNTRISLPLRHIACPCAGPPHTRRPWARISSPGHLPPTPSPPPPSAGIVLLSRLVPHHELAFKPVVHLPVAVPLLWCWLGQAPIIVKIIVPFVDPRCQHVKVRTAIPAFVHQAGE